MLVPFDQLSKDMRDANFNSARTIPRKLKLLGIELHKSLAGSQLDLPEFAPDEIESLSKWDNAFWNWQIILQGWIYGPPKDEAQKTHLCIVPCNQLTNNIPEYDRENVRLIPGIIGEAGYVEVRVKKVIA